MKKLIINTLTAFALFACFSASAYSQAADPAAVPTEGPMIKFEEETHDFGDLMQGGDASYVFKFTNTGTTDLKIESAKGSCGCTVPNWSSDPVAPGAEGEIKVQYDSNRIGGISKSVTINSNAVNEPVKTIFIKGNILQKPAEPDYLARPEGAPVNPAPMGAH
ncbi:MAG: hypothetical protein RLZZ165_595 [Bacteroidota bacterium]|jgi:hypothetical protein